MSGSHEKLPKLFWVQIALVLIVLGFYLFTPSPSKHGEHEVSPETQKALKPIGKVAVAKEAGGTAGGSERSGEEIVNKTCMSCHAAGVANAPKLDASGKAAWQERYAKGIDSMIQTAKTGKGGMPPMGADPTLTDGEIKNAIVYMLGKAGIDASADSGTASANAEAAPTNEAAPAATAEAPAATNPSAESAAVAATPPVPPSTPAAPEPPNNMAAAPAPPAQPIPVSEPTAPAATVAASSAAPVATASNSSIDGEKIYKASCFACHDMAVAGAPKTGDKASWEARIAQGKEALYHSAINGKAGASGVMPPKGGNLSLSDDQVKAVVDYMINRVQ